MSIKYYYVVTHAFGKGNLIIIVTRHFILSCVYACILSLRIQKIREEKENAMMRKSACILCLDDAFRK